MNIGTSSTRRSSYSVAVFALVSLLSSSCVGEETYADQVIDSIEADCQKTALCDPVFSVRADAVNECVKDTSTKLNTGSDAFRAMYKMRTGRCAQYTECQYYDCARDTMLYSATHQALLSYECQQSTLCKIQMGQPTMPNDNDVCFGMLAAKLDFSAIADRAVWEQRIGRCMMQQGCAYVNCQ
jgi:hypothetical protein